MPKNNNKQTKKPPQDSCYLDTKKTHCLIASLRIMNLIKLSNFK